MRAAVVLAAVGTVTASAIVPPAYPILPRRGPESYNITLGVWIKSHYLGVVHQLADGQLRVGDGSIPVANFTFTPDPSGAGGGIVDSNNHGCIVTPGPHKQFQCDEGVKPGPGFDFSCGGRLTYHGSEEFWVCPVDNNGIRNLYVEPIPKQMHCRYVYISAVWPSEDIDNRAGCIKTYDSKPWIFVWDKLYNNTNPVHPDSPDGPRQIEGWRKYSNGVPVDEILGKPHQNHNHQSHTGRCGPSTGLDCYGKADGPCCSSYGWCGFSPLHCGAGCQSGFGICDSSSPAKPSNAISTSGKVSKASTSVTVAHSGRPTPSVQKHNASSRNGRCGGVDGYTCIGFTDGPCCSKKGWCGTSFSHCAASEGCQSEFGKCEVLHPGNEVQYNTTDKKMPTSHIGVPIHPTPSQSTESSVHATKSRPSHEPQGTKEAESDRIDCNNPKNSNKCADRYSVHGCPHDLEGGFEFPHLIVPVDKEHPDRAIGNQFNGTIDDERCTIYNFDINPKQAGKKCSLVWLFPEKDNHKDGSFAFRSEPNSSSVMEFWHLGDSATEKTTWNTVGSKQIIAAGPVHPGFNCNAKTVQCAAGSQQAFMVCGRDFSLNYFQNSGERPIGLYVRTC